MEEHVNAENENNDSSSSDSVPTNGKPSNQGSKPTEQLPSDRMPVENQLKVRAAVGIAANTKQGPVSNEEAGDIIALKAPTVVVTNAFFVDLGLISRSGPGQFNVSDIVREYQQAVEWEQDDPAHKLVSAFKDRWFSHALLSRLKMRDNLSEKQAISAMAEACKAGPKYESQLRNLLKFMELVGLVRVDGGLVSLGPTGSTKRIEDKKHGGDSAGDTGRGNPPPPPPPPSAGTIPADAPFLFLDPSRTKKLTLVLDAGDASLTKSEKERIKQWIDLVFFTTDAEG